MTKFLNSKLATFLLVGISLFALSLNIRQLSKPVEADNNNVDILILVEQSRTATLIDQINTTDDAQLNIEFTSQWESVKDKMSYGEVDALIIDRSTKMLVNRSELSTWFQEEKIIVSGLGIPGDELAEMVNMPELFTSTWPQLATSTESAYGTENYYYMYGFQIDGTITDQETFMQSDAIADEDTAHNLDIESPLTASFSASTDSLTAVGALERMLERIKVEAISLQSLVPTSIALESVDTSENEPLKYAIVMLTLVLITYLLLRKHIMQYGIVNGFLVAVCLLLLSSAYFGIAEAARVTICNAGYCMTGEVIRHPDHGNEYENRWTSQSGNSNYYVSTFSKVWGHCTPDMGGCTSNRWKVKENKSKTVYWGNYAEIDATSGNFYYGVGVSKHTSIPHPAGYINLTTYITEYGEGWADGANASCYYLGPAATALNVDDHGGTAGYDTVDPRWGLPCP